MKVDTQWFVGMFLSCIQETIDVHVVSMKFD